MGCLVWADGWDNHTPLLTEAINYQAQKGKPELERLGIGREGVDPIFPLDADVAGAALLASPGPVSEALRNAYGSDQIHFTFHLLANGGPEEDEVVVDLPLARHEQKPLAVVSHRTGKKAKTTFRRLGRIGKAAFWTAETTYLRWHQLYRHAEEIGLRLMGTVAYGGMGPLYLSMLKRNYRPSRTREETPLYPGGLLRLAEVRFPDPARTAHHCAAPARLGHDGKAPAGKLTKKSLSARMRCFLFHLLTLFNTSANTHG